MEEPAPPPDGDSAGLSTRVSLHTPDRPPGVAGEYAGFDESQPTAESGGKGKVIASLKERYGFQTVVMIGDGATDLEACPPAVSPAPVPRAAVRQNGVTPRVLSARRAPSWASAGTWCGRR